MLSRSMRPGFLIALLLIGNFDLVHGCFSKTHEAKVNVQRGPPEKFIVSRGGSIGPEGQSGGSKQFETFYQSEGCSYFPHSWRNSIDAFYTNSDKDCIEICAEDWCQACSRVPHAVRKGQDLEILAARAALGKLAKTYRSCKK